MDEVEAMNYVTDKYCRNKDGSRCKIFALGNSLGGNLLANGLCAQLDDSIRPQIDAAVINNTP